MQEVYGELLLKSENSQHFNLHAKRRRIINQSSLFVRLSKQFDLKFKLAPSYIQDLFSTNHIAYNLRVKEFTIPRFNSIHYGKHSLRYLGPVLWAKLPSRVRTLHSLASFKRAVRGLDLEMLMDDSGFVCMVCNA